MIRYHFVLTQEHINKAGSPPGSGNTCPVWQCIHERFPKVRLFVAQHSTDIGKPREAYETIENPAYITEFTKTFDNGIKVEPFQFDMYLPDWVVEYDSQRTN